LSPYVNKIFPFVRVKDRRKRADIYLTFVCPRMRIFRQDVFKVIVQYPKLFTSTHYTKEHYMQALRRLTGTTEKEF
jgi:hypothetical protein